MEDFLAPLVSPYSSAATTTNNNSNEEGLEAVVTRGSKKQITELLQELKEEGIEAAVVRGSKKQVTELLQELKEEGLEAAVIQGSEQQVKELLQEIEGPTHNHRAIPIADILQRHSSTLLDDCNQSHTYAVVRIRCEGSEGEGLKMKLLMTLSTWIELFVDPDVDDFYVSLFKQAYSYPKVAFSGNMIEIESESDSASDNESGSLE